MFQADEVNQEIILDLLRLRGSLSAYVSSEEIKQIRRAEKSFDSGKIDNDGLLAIVCSARKKAEKRFARKDKLRKNLQQAIQKILGRTNNWPVFLRVKRKDRCKEEQSWLDGQVNKNDELPTADEIVANACKEAECMKSRLKPEHSVRQPVSKPTNTVIKAIPHFHLSWNVPSYTMTSKMRPIDLYDTRGYVIRGDSDGIWLSSIKCFRSKCPSRGKPHSHTINACEYDARGWYYLILCTEYNCALPHAHPQDYDEDWLFNALRNKDCDCTKLHQHPKDMPEEGEIFEQPVVIPS